MNRELPDVPAGFRKGRGTRDQIDNICWIIKKQENSRKISTSASLTALKPLPCGLQQAVKIFPRNGHTRPPDLPLEKPVCRSGSNS